MKINRDNKGIIALLLALNLLLVFIAASTLSAFGADPAKSYQVGEDVIASLSPTGTLTITGSGPTYDYSVNSPAPFYKNSIRITNIVLGGGITSIGDYLFYDLYCVKGEIIIPETVITIGHCAFSGTNIDMAPHFDRVVNQFTQLEMVIPKSDGNIEEQDKITTVEETIIDEDAPQTEAVIDKIVEEVNPDDKPIGPEKTSPTEPQAPTISEESTEPPTEAIPAIPVMPEQPVTPIEPSEPPKPIENEIEIKIITEQEIRGEVFYRGQTGVFYAEDNNISFINACSTAGYSNAKDFGIVREPISVDYVETIRTGAANFDIWVNAENENSIIYNWQAFIDGEWLSVDDGNSEKLSIDAIDAMVNSTVYRCEAEYNSEKIYSQSVEVTLVLPEPLITEIEQMTTLTATLPDISGYDLQVKWEYSDNYSYDSNTIWTEIEGQNETVYIVEEKKPNRYYRYTLIANKASAMMFTLAPVPVETKGIELKASIPVVLATSATAWTGGYNTYWYIKDKTATVYTLSTAEELAGFAQIVNGQAYETNELGVVTTIAIAQDSFNGKTINLGADILLNPGILTHAADGYPLYNGGNAMYGVHKWTPIGMGIKNENGFKGNFEGHNYNISGLYIDEGSNYQGFFSYLENSNLSNICITNSYVRGTGNINGGIVANIHANATIKNCNFSGTVLGADYIGAIVGKVEEAATVKITKCKGEGTIKGKQYVGGIVGAGTEIVIVDCIFSGEVNGTSDIGGMIGNAQNSSVARCTSDGTIIGVNNNIGGLVGYANETTISDSYFSGTAIGTDASSVVGGIVGICYKRLATKVGIEDCYNTGNIEGGRSAGGIVGETYRAITNCYNTGTITGKSKTTTTGGIAGGIIFVDINNCYNSGNISNIGGIEADVGQLVGSALGGSLQYSYFLNKMPGGVAIAELMETLSIGNGAVTPITFEIDIEAVIENTSKENKYVISGTTKLVDALNAYVIETHIVEMSQWVMDPNNPNSIIFAVPEAGTETFVLNILPGAYYTSIPANSPQEASITANSRLTMQFTGAYNKKVEDKHVLICTSPIPKGTNMLLIDIVDAAPVFYKYKVETDNKMKIYFEEFIAVNATRKNYEERGSSTELLTGTFMIILDFEKAVTPPKSNEITHMIGSKDGGKLTYIVNPSVIFTINMEKSYDKSVIVNTTKSGEIVEGSLYSGKSPVTVFTLKDSQAQDVPFALKISGNLEPYPSHRGKVMVPMNNLTQIQAELDESSISLKEGAYTLYAELSMTQNIKGPMQDIVTSRVSVPMNIGISKKYELGINKGKQLIKPEENSIILSLPYHIENADNQTLTLSVEAQKLISSPNNYEQAKSWNINDKKIIVIDGKASGILTGVEIEIPQGIRSSSASTYRLKFILSNPTKALVEVYYPIILLPNA